MKRAPLFHVRPGSMKTVRERSVLSAVVVAGLVVTVRSRTAPVGAMLHVPTDLVLPALDRAPLLRKLADLSATFRGSGGVLAEAMVDVAGCADVLGILPRGRRLQLAADCADLVRAWVEGEGARLRNTALGGELGRSVTLEVRAGDGSVRIRSIVRPERPERRTSGDAAPYAAAAAPGRNGNGFAVPAPLLESRARNVHMGEQGIGRAPDVLCALLGSCVGIALFHPPSGVGGLAHVMLPVHPGNDEPRSKYADTAVADLVEALARAGAVRGELEARIAGGANVLAHDAANLSDMPARNVEGVRNALSRAQIPVLSEHVLGRVGRKMTVKLEGFSVEIKELHGATRSAVTLTAGRGGER